MKCESSGCYNNATNRGYCDHCQGIVSNIERSEREDEREELKLDVLREVHLMLSSWGIRPPQTEDSLHVE